jgi:hypothetical protein
MMHECLVILISQLRVSQVGLAGSELVHHDSFDEYRQLVV